MDDFVAEVRPIVYKPPPPFTPTPSSGDFVAEIRPPTQSGMTHRRGQCHDEEMSNQELLNILSGEHFSREGIARILRGSVLDIVEKLLIGRPLFRVEGHLSVSFSNNELPISVVINKTYSSNNSPSDYGPMEQALKESFNVKVRNGHSGMCPMNVETFGATSPLFEFEREQCNNVAETDDKSSLYSENHRDMDSLACSPQHCFLLNTPTLSPRDDEPAMRLQVNVPGPGAQFENHRRHDSEDDDESGYTSNERGDSDTCYGQHSGCKCGPVKLYNPFNDYYCSGFDGDKTFYTPSGNQTAVSNSKRNSTYFSGPSTEGTEEIRDGEEDFEFSHRLVIDESPHEVTRDGSVNNGCRSGKELGKEFGQSMDIDVEDVLDVSESSRHNTQRHCFTEGAQMCASGFSKDADHHDSSDITDTDVPVDVSGDSNITQDTASVFPHVQSPVFKHPDGFRCKECCHILEDVAAVAFHVQAHHDLHFCTICCRTFTAKNNLKRHLRIHTGQRPYKCTQCPQSFARRDDLKDHTLRHEYNNPFRCSVCKRGYTDRASVKNHMAKEHGSRLMHVCPQCGESHDDEESFAEHKKTHPELQQFSCSKCSFIGTNHQMAQKHTLVHTYKLFSCKPCNAHFADPFDYTNHIRKHKKTASFSQYVCCFCDLTLTTYDQFIRHEYSHAQAKTHGCKICKKLFKTKSLLQDHAVIHQDLHFDKAESLQQCAELSPETESILRRIETSPETESILRRIETSPKVQTIKRLFRSSPEGETFQPSDKLSPEVSIHRRSVETTSDFNDSTSMFWQPSEGQDNIAFSPNTKPKSPLDSALLSQPPKTDSPTSKRKDNYDFQGELLDLSMKKPKSSITRTDNPRMETSFSPRSSETRVLEKNFLRNDVVLSDSSFLRQGHEEDEQALRECLNENTGDLHRGRLYLRAENSFDSSMNSEWDSSSSPEGPTSHSSLATASRGSKNIFSQPFINAQQNSEEHDGNVDDCPRDRPGKRFLGHRTYIDNVQKPSFRFSPYSREKIADLAAKFVAARGTDIFHQRTFQKTVTPSWKNRHVEKPATLKEEVEKNESPDLARLKCKGTSTLKTLSRFTQSPVPVRTMPSTGMGSTLIREVNSSHEILREESNPETALSHAAFLVKPEPLLESDLPSKDVVKGRLHREECSGVQSSTPSVCEDCKEVFGSFSELENHSVEMHKRFLCEHCKKSFTARPNRDRHVRYHTGERPYKCDLCDMAFFRGDDLKYHRTTRHPSAQPFICSRCDASFAWRRDLDRHIRHSKCKS